jgi:Protein of unknown function (DUF3822)
MNYLKTAFKIEPESNPAQPHDLLIEVGGEGISFVYYVKDPLRIDGLYIYYFDKNSTVPQMADELEILFAERSLPVANNCTICYNYKEATLVPSIIYEGKMRTDILDVLYAHNGPVADYAEKVAAPDAYVLYRVDQKVEAVLQQQYPLAKRQHSNTLLIPALKESNDFLYCIIYQKSIKVFLYKDAALQIVQYFDYTTPADVAYYLLNLCSLHDISPAVIKVTLSGFIDTKSNLYDELYRYFLNIQVDESLRDMVLANGISQYPLHFFSHLISLVKCVS